MRGIARTHGSRGSQKCPVQLAGMYLLCFIDGLMFCKTRGTTVVILRPAMDFFFFLRLAVFKAAPHVVAKKEGSGGWGGEKSRRV